MTSAHMRGAIALGTILLAGGCDKRRCNDLVDPGAAYTVDVLDLYDMNSVFLRGASWNAAEDGRPPESCMGRDGIVSGAQLKFQGNGEILGPHETCLLATAGLTSAPSQIVLDSPSRDENALRLGQAGAFLVAAENVTIEGCRGTLSFGFARGGGSAAGIFSPSNVGALPAVVMYRVFAAADASCSSCDDNFVVKVTPEASR